VWETLKQACGAILHGLPVDAEGVRVEALEACLARGPLKLLLLTPHSHFPTGVRLSPSRRARILELSRLHRFPILELDLEHDYRPDPESLAALDPGQVLHFGSLSRVFAPGLGVSYLVAPGPLAPLLARARTRLDWQGDPVQEWALSELFVDGELQRHLLRVRKAAAERSGALQDALAHAMGDRLEGHPGAMAFWLEGRGVLEAPAAFNTWIKACQAKGLKLRPGRHYRLDGAPAAATRLGFTAFTPEELQRAVAMLR
jgi:GntR family transcriptional regulator/MocR family aminotransferase